MAEPDRQGGSFVSASGWSGWSGSGRSAGPTSGTTPPPWSATSRAPVARPDADPGAGRLLHRNLGLVVALAGVLYSLWVLEPWLNPALDPWQSYVSELSARDQPGSGVFAFADALSAVLLAVTAVGLLYTARSGPWSTAGWCLQILFGGVSVADSLARLDCAPSASTTCALRERAGLVSAGHQAHSVTSTLAILFVLASMTAGTLASRRTGRWPLLARFGPVLVLAQAASSLLTLLLAVGGTDLGISERVQVGGVSVWYVLLGAALWSEAAPDGAGSA